MKLVFIVIAIVLTILLCRVNIRTALRSSIWIHAGSDLLLLFGIIVFLHGILLFLLIVAVQKLSLSYMLMVWGILIFIYAIPPVKSHLNRIERRKERERKRVD
ncbi:hypothetical protein D0T60_15725 [Bacteroides sp. 224]|nr:hypothetical protein [Bacteroides sp. 224]